VAGRPAPFRASDRFGSRCPRLATAALVARSDRSLPAGAATARCPPCQGQAQLKLGTSSTWRIGELQLTGVRGGQPPGDVEPKPEPAAVGGRGRVQAHMPLEDPAAIGQRDPRPLILDGHQRVPAGLAGRESNRRALWGVGGGVVEQVAEDAADGQWVDPHRQRPSSLDGDRTLSGPVGLDQAPWSGVVGPARPGRPACGLPDDRACYHPAYILIIRDGR